MVKEVRVKSTEIFLGVLYNKFDPMLCEIAAVLVTRIQAADIVPVITSAYRPKDEDSVHKYMRGLDFRTHDMTNGFIITLCNEINTRWMYDPSRSDMDCLIFHDTGRGPHLHLQVHPNTSRVNVK